MVALCSAFLVLSLWGVSSAQPTLPEPASTLLSSPPSASTVAPLLEGSVFAESRGGTNVCLRDSNCPSGTNLPQAVKHATYLIEISGTYQTDRRFKDSLGDAECTTADLVRGTNDGNWLENRYLVFGFQQTGFQTNATKRYDPLTNPDPYDVYLDGAAINWRPTNGDPTHCNVETHTYDFVYTPTESRILNLRVREPFPNFKLSQGRLKFKVFPGPEAESGPDDKFIETLFVDPRDGDGTRSLFSFVAGKTYRLVAKGVYEHKVYQRTADAECSITPFDDNWVADRFSDQRGFDSLDLLVDEAEYTWFPLVDTTGKGCNAWNHAYRLNHQRPRTGTVLFRIKTWAHPSNTGSLQVDIYEVNAGVARQANNQITPPALPSGKHVEDVSVNVRNPAGVFTKNTLEPTKVYRIVASGVYRWEPGNPNSLSDSECLTTGRPGFNEWSPNHALSAAVRPNSATPGALTREPNDPFDLYVDGVARRWVATVPDAAGCNTQNHTYELAEFFVDAKKQVNFAVFDPFFTGKGPAGALLVRIFEAPPPVQRAGDVLIGVLTVKSTDESPTRFPVPLLADQKYRYVAEGVYTMRWNGMSADAECTQTIVHPDWVPDRFETVAGFDKFDLFIDDGEVRWTPVIDTGKGCNAKNNTYLFEETPTEEKFVTFKIAAPAERLSDGMLTIKIFQVGVLPSA